MAELTGESEAKNPEEPTLPEKRAERRQAVKTLLAAYRNSAPEDHQLRDNIELAVEDMIYQAEITDPDTGFYNKKGLSEELPRLMELAKRTGASLSLLFFDGRRLKRVNEELSFEKGNLVIQTMAEAIKQTTRKSDIPARINPYEETAKQPQHIATRPGGDEFVIILFDINQYQAVNVARRTQDRIQGISPKLIPFYEEAFGEEFTARVGIAQYDPEIDTDYKTFLDRADQAVKSAKVQRIPDNICVNQYDPETKTSKIIPMKGSQLILPEETTPLPKAA